MVASDVRGNSASSIVDGLSNVVMEAKTAQNSFLERHRLGIAAAPASWQTDIAERELSAALA